ncbi:MAG: hypothetical protein VW625_04955, partial [Perlucidibaca sp.]
MTDAAAASTRPQEPDQGELSRLASDDAALRLQRSVLGQVHRQLPRFLFITAASILATVWLLWDWPFASNSAILGWAYTFLAFLLIRGLLVWWLGRALAQNTR